MRVDRPRWRGGVALVLVSALFVACAGRKAPAGPPPEYERTALPPWPPASASAQNRPVPPPVPPDPAPGAVSSSAPQTPVLSDRAPEAIDPPQGSR